MTKLKTGDKVKIVRYGHLIWYYKSQYPKEYTNHPKNVISETDTIWWVDMRPDLVGKEDVVEQVTNTQGRAKYSLVKNRAWYSDDNLELL